MTYSTHGWKDRKPEMLSLVLGLDAPNDFGTIVEGLLCIKCGLPENSQPNES